MKNAKGMGVGSASVLIIFVLLCLTCFGVLSYASAKGDYSLAERTAQSVTDWYAADTRAAQRIDDIKSRAGAIKSVDEQEFWLTCPEIMAVVDVGTTWLGENRFCISEGIDEKRELRVVFEVVNSDEFLKIESWQTEVISTAFVEDEEMGLWSGMEVLG